MNTQFKKGVLEICILCLIKKEDMYGYQIVSELERYFDVSVNTVYPILRRLTSEGYLATYDSDKNERRRKYYTISNPGQDYYEKNYDEWKDFNERVARLLKEAQSNEQS